MTASPSQPVSAAGEPTPLDEKVTFLQRPEIYPEPTRQVDAIETHMAWVFLTDERAYKLKKPVRYAYLDFSTIDARRFDCLEEVRLNRPLAPDVYLGTVPLTLADDAPAGGAGDEGSRQLALGGTGSVVDWLVAMRRLPRDRMLDRALEAGTWTGKDVDGAIGWLVRFYRYAARVIEPPDVYLAGLRCDIRENRDELWSMQPLPEPERARVSGIGDALLRCTEILAAQLGRRARDGRVVEGHGDLRPEHIHLGPPPAVIDCIEFNRAFRVLDTADDLAFLRLECERLGAPAVGDRIFATYRRLSGDDADESLVAFYMAHRALLRAKIALWHLADRDVLDADRWLDRTLEYIELAERFAERAER